MQRCMNYEETRSDFLGAITDLLVQACYERDHQRKYRDVRRKENKLPGGVGQGTEQRKYPPLVIRHCIHLVRKQHPEPEIEGDVLHSHDHVVFERDQDITLCPLSEYAPIQTGKNNPGLASRASGKDDR